MDPINGPLLVLDPFARARERLNTALQGKALPPKPNWKEDLKTEGWDRFHADLNYSATPPVVIFMRSPKTLPEANFHNWLIKLKKLKEPLEIIFDQGSMLSFPEKMFTEWRNAVPDVATIRFKNSLAGEREGVYKVLRGVSEQLRVLDFHDCQNFVWEDWDKFSGICTGLTECNLSGCREVNIGVCSKFCTYNPLLQRLILKQLEINSEIFQQISQREALFDELDLEGSSLTDQTLVVSAQTAPSKLKKLNLSHCEKISENGLRPFLERWSSVQTLDVSHVANLSTPGVQAILRIENLRVLALNNVKGVNDDCFSQEILEGCGLFTLSIQQTAVSAKGLRCCLTMIKGLETVDVSHCPRIEQSDLVTLQKGFPHVKILSNKLPRNVGTPFLLDIKGILADNFKLYLSCVFPNSEINYHEANNQWDLKFYAEHDTSPALWGAELAQMVYQLSKSQMRVTIFSRKGIVPATAPVLCALIHTLSPVITELTVKGNFPLASLPRLKKLELEGWTVDEGIAQGLKLPELRILALNGVSFVGRAAALLAGSVRTVEEITLRQGSLPLTWNALTPFATLPNVLKLSFDIPQEDPQAAEGIDLAFALWINQSEPEKSRRIAKGVVERIPFTYELPLLCRALKVNFTPIIEVMLSAWNAKYGRLLSLCYENGSLKGKMQLPLPQELALTLEMQQAMVRAAAALPIEWYIEVAPNAPLNLPSELQALAKAIAPSISTFIWKHEVKNEKKPLPVPSLAPFLTQASGLKHLTLAHVSLTTAALKEVFAQPGLQSLTLVCCQGISAQEIRSWALWKNSLEKLTMRECEFIPSPTLENALGETFTALQQLNLEGCAAVTNGWMNSLSAACTSLETLNLKRTSVDSECFTSPHFEFTSLKGLNIAQTEVTDEGLLKLTEKDRHLRTLDISGCYISGAGFLNFGLKAPLLEEIIWKDCPIATPSGVATLAMGSPYLKFLDLTGSRLHALTGLETVFEKCLQLEKIVVDSPEIPRPLAEALRNPFSSNHLAVQERRLTDEQLSLWRKTIKSVTSLTMKGCSEMTAEGFKQMLTGTDLEEIDLFVKLPGHNVLESLGTHAGSLKKITLRAPMGGLTDLVLASFLLSAKCLTHLILEHRAEHGEKCPLTRPGLERILIRENSLKEFKLQGISLEAPPRRISIEASSSEDNPWSPRKEFV